MVRCDSASVMNRVKLKNGLSIQFHLPNAAAWRCASLSPDGSNVKRAERIGFIMALMTIFT